MWSGGKVRAKRGECKEGKLLHKEEELEQLERNCP